MRHGFVFALLLCFTGAARAELGLSVHGQLGFGGEVEGDQINDDDLESNFGLAVAYEYPLHPHVRLGGRIGFMVASTDDSNADVNTYDLGAWSRFPFPVSPKVSLYGALGLGVTFMTSKVEYTGGSVKGDGTGWHVLAGGGATIAVSPSLAVIVGAFYGRQSVGEVEGDENGVRLRVEDVLASRFVLTAGVAF